MGHLRGASDWQVFFCNQVVTCYVQTCNKLRLDYVKYLICQQRVVVTAV